MRADPEREFKEIKLTSCRFAKASDVKMTSACCLKPVRQW